LHGRGRRGGEDAGEVGQEFALDEAEGSVFVAFILGGAGGTVGCGFGAVELEALRWFREAVEVGSVRRVVL